MAVLTTQQIGLAGITPAYTAAAASQQFIPDERTFVHVKNTDGSPVTVTIETPRTGVAGAAVADLTLTVPATTGDKFRGPFPTADFQDTTDLRCDITYSATTGVTVAVLRA